MNRTVLEMFLPAFMVTVVAVLFVWTLFRSSQPIRVVQSSNDLVRRVSRIKTGYLILLGLSVLIALIYTYWPEYYYWMVPIDLLDHPAINTTGVLILQISLGWLVVAQLNIDKVIFQVNSGLDEWSYHRLVLYSQRLLLSGMLVMFIGVFVTISNLAGIVICIVSIGLFERLPRTA